MCRKNKPIISRKVFDNARNSHNYIKGLRSMFDFNGMVALAGLWVVWNTFLVSIVPNTFLLDAVNYVGQGRKRSFKFPAKRNGRSAFQDRQDQDEFEQIVQMLQNGKM